MKKEKTIKAWVHLEGFNPICWGWWCYPFLNVKMSGVTETPMGAKRAAERTIKRLGFKPEVKILWPKNTISTVKAI
jgi:hypothetical protein